jgi:hypothetical protein
MFNRLHHKAILASLFFLLDHTYLRYSFSVSSVVPYLLINLIVKLGTCYGSSPSRTRIVNTRPPFFESFRTFLNFPLARSVLSFFHRFPHRSFSLPLTKKVASRTVVILWCIYQWCSLVKLVTVLSLGTQETAKTTWVQMRNGWYCLYSTSFSLHLAHFSRYVKLPFIFYFHILCGPFPSLSDTSRYCLHVSNLPAFVPSRTMTMYLSLLCDVIFHGQWERQTGMNLILCWTKEHSVFVLDPQFQLA